MTTVKQTTETINTNFLQEWQPYSEVEAKVKKAIVKHLRKYKYQWQPTHQENSRRTFHPSSFTEVDNILGLAYTSSSSYAGLWVCNAGYLMVNDSYYFTGFAVNTAGEVIGIAGDHDENEIFIKL